MRKTGLVFTFAFSAANATVVITPTPLDVERISLADAKKAFDADAAVFVDVRAPEAYKAQHIKGALNIPVTEIDAGVSKLPKGKKIIVYCS
jgi:rhodanese-related sulfurtransferase